ncbi:hypothetical protein DUI87_33747 [Hirundo rustica rustica]|uniref:Uncharacterized protein n=1 Tax=Hirundo rustica rustica TaxID=333673 RepID=A0A3M0ISP8_HIRRU|nr:hypothetical protein DUI87_33747 [Hirundo rustica rustica]
MGFGSQYRDINIRYQDQDRKYQDVEEESLDFGYKSQDLGYNYHDSNHDINVQRVMPNDSFSIVRDPGTLGPSFFC